MSAMEAVVAFPSIWTAQPPAIAFTETKWRSPKRMDDLSAFNISAFAGGQDNLEIIQGIPSSITPHSHAKWRDSSSLQLLYPAGSINPAHRPVGGAQFYAAPLDLSRAHNVSLAYSAFFPPDFDWVRGGKMPGLYGGHTGCSGGNPALDCWSTRLMWRSNGRGELYLYAPKTKQPHTLCTDPRSVCDAAYGLSIGRGAFAWAPGRWTTVRQTVALNTPGKPDGCFALDVNGVRVIDRCDIFYRDAPHGPGTGAGDGDGGGGGEGTGGGDGSGGGGGDGGEGEGGGGGLGGLLGQLLSDLFKRETRGPSPPISTFTLTLPASAVASAAVTATAVAVDTQAGRDGGGDGHHNDDDNNDNDVAHPTRMYDVQAQQAWAVPQSQAQAQPTPPPLLLPLPPLDSASASSASASKDANAADAEDNANATTAHDAVVGFTGLFFSSFFGGHGARYATPTDQYVWFKDFSISYNS